MDKRTVIAEINQCANYFDEIAQPELADELTKVAVKLAQYLMDDPNMDDGFGPSEWEAGDSMNQGFDHEEDDLLDPDLDLEGEEGEGGDDSILFDENFLSDSEPGWPEGDTPFGEQLDGGNDQFDGFEF